MWLTIWDKVFKNGPSKICERQTLKIFTWSFLEYFVPYIYTTKPIKAIGHLETVSLNVTEHLKRPWYLISYAKDLP